MRSLLFVGKGGVGKTMVSAATAIATSERGKETLVTSADPAHSLSDVFDRELGPEPRKLSDNLYGQELDVRHEMDKYWNRIRRYMEELFLFLDLEKVKVAEMAIFSGMEEEIPISETS